MSIPSLKNIFIMAGLGLVAGLFFEMMYFREKAIKYDDLTTAITTDRDSVTYYRDKEGRANATATATQVQYDNFKLLYAGQLDGIKQQIGKLSRLTGMSQGSTSSTDSIFSYTRDTVFVLPGNDTTRHTAKHLTFNNGHLNLDGLFFNSTFVGSYETNDSFTVLYHYNKRGWKIWKRIFWHPVMKATLITQNPNTRIRGFKTVFLKP
ncbi:MAG: hypothetical protein EXR21_09955 [Flavobacteriaceae bacterium]|nr:hypothetical protein [Flavobacteriaceae bacterium]